MTGCKPANFNLIESVDDVPVNKERYQRLVGKLIYLSHTKPDISYAVSLVNQFMQAPYKRHMEAVTRILRYLKSSLGKGLVFRKHDKRCIKAYIDSNWVDSVIDKKSTLGYCTFVWGNLVTWRSNKQGVVARSKVLWGQLSLLKHSRQGRKGGRMEDDIARSQDFKSWAWGVTDGIRAEPLPVRCSPGTNKWKLVGM
ncbi:uncharacterized mitochondrial protein AtMg00810-like [Benincasa hispida]|uniref:uncharacterized mitochondrial protein AtMg00810-like n=1 Tax=Benincasa hispida TaxID=102211 RepID=UPI0018FF1B26|nr:uncharacterized mitochondrial protein AtMg00810-like [Benincasa hispida]